MRKPVPYIVDKESAGRIRFVRAFFLLATLGIVSRLFYWQILQSDNLQAAAESQYNSVTRISGSRGKILASDGYPLVTNIDVYTLFSEPKKLEIAPEKLAEILAPLLREGDLQDNPATEEATVKQIETGWKTTIISRLTTSSARWVVLKRKLPREIKERIEAMQIKGLGFDREEIRYYPEASMAANVVGFVGSDQQGVDLGYFGVEGRYDRELRGRSGVLTQEKDATGLPIAIGDYDMITSQDGRDVTLSIRRDLQFLLEEKLKKGMETYGSKTAEAIIMDPKTGEILAMAAFPNYNPRNFYQFDPQLYKNPLVHDAYEPGSTMKILTVAAAIDAGAITPDTQCDHCEGPREISGYTIRTWNNKYFPNTTITDGLVHSDNTAMIFTEEKLGKDKLVEYLQKFGLGEKTDIDIQEETQPPFRKDWKDIDAATASFGQGIAVTGIQMLRIAQVIANNGVMMRPLLVKEVRQNGQSIVVQPREVRRVISPETAHTVTTMMEASAQHGDAKWAIPKGYRIAGKTGTAQIAVAGHYDENKTVASFVGFAPAENPRFVMLVKLREPQSSPWGSETAAPLWFSIARDLFIHLNIAPN